MRKGERYGYRWPVGIKNLDQYRMYLYNSETPEEQLEIYSLFLHDGDYEKYIPLIFGYTNKQKHEIQKELVRWLWIRCRVCELDSKEHHEYERMLAQEFDQLKP